MNKISEGKKKQIKIEVFYVFKTRNNQTNLYNLMTKAQLKLEEYSENCPCVCHEDKHSEEKCTNDECPCGKVLVEREIIKLDGMYYYLEEINVPININGDIPNPLAEIAASEIETIFVKYSQNVSPKDILKIVNDNL